MTEIPWLVPLVALAVGFAGTGMVRRYALRRQLVDHPNARSSHAVPTPRGGGLAMVVAFGVGSLLWFLGSGGPDWRVGLAMAGLVPTALVGWLDDRSSLPARLRILAHVATACMIAPLGIAASTDGSPLGLGLLGAWWAFATVSAINVVNFMDGLDGLIGLQAGIFGVHLALLSGAPTSATLALALAGAAVGFLVWNWHPARIFMGDVGSGSLGAMGMICGLLVLAEGAVGVLPAFLPLAPIFADATVTLLRRMARGERIWEAHREHLYQRLAHAGWGHARVTLLYGGMALLGSMAANAATPGPDTGILLAYGALLPAVGIALEWYLRGTRAQGEARRP